MKEIKLPCGLGCVADCPIRTKMIALQRSLVPLPEDDTRRLVKAFTSSYEQLYRATPTERRNLYPPNVALATLFDFVVSARYAAELLVDTGWVYCAGTAYGEGPSLYFPYLKTCPRCSVKAGIRPNVESNKPESDPIGRIAAETNMAILAEVIGRVAPNTQVATSTNRRGDIDAVIFDDEMLALAEIKSSPLVIYPLEIRLSREMTEQKEGKRTPLQDHTSPVTCDTSATQPFLYIPHKDLRIALGSTTQDRWPFDNLVNYVSDPNNVAILISAWKELFDWYQSVGWARGRDNKRWITCGCGERVDDSKNAPGMDRTDDAKKGTYQALKIGTYYKEQCPKRIIKAIVVSNLLPLRTYEAYLSRLEDIIWTRDDYSVVLPPTAVGQDLKAFNVNDLFYLYDALIGLTRSIYHDDHLRDITSLEAFEKSLTK